MNLPTKNKNILAVLVASGALYACGTERIPTPQRLADNVASIPMGTTFSVVSRDTYATPKGAQIIEKNGTYKTIDNVYDTDGQQILIPKGAIIGGFYTNDGVNCKITWRSIYVNEAEYKADKGSLVLESTAVPSICDPTRGISSGDRLTITFRQ